MPEPGAVLTVTGAKVKFANDCAAQATLAAPGGSLEVEYSLALTTSTRSARAYTRTPPESSSTRARAFTTPLRMARSTLCSPRPSLPRRASRQTGRERKPSLATRDGSCQVYRRLRRLLVLSADVAFY